MHGNNTEFPGIVATVGVYGPVLKTRTIVDVGVTRSKNMMGSNWKGEGAGTRVLAVMATLRSGLK